MVIKSENLNVSLANLKFSFIPRISIRLRLSAAIFPWILWAWVYGKWGFKWEALTINLYLIGIMVLTIPTTVFLLSKNEENTVKSDKLKLNTSILMGLALMSVVLSFAVFLQYVVIFSSKGVFSPPAVHIVFTSVVFFRLLSDLLRQVFNGPKYNK